MTQELSKTNEQMLQDAATKIEIRPYSKKELRNLYGISVTTFRKWFEGHDAISKADKFRRIFNVREVEYIFKTFGYPKNVVAK
jgi:hypothetical protein